jgi:hypothetical protein
MMGAERRWTTPGMSRARHASMKHEKFWRFLCSSTCNETVRFPLQKLVTSVTSSSQSKSGFLVESAGRTVTHLEYIEAIANKKLIQVFIAKKTKKAYFGYVRGAIFKFIDQYEEQHNGRHPSKADILEYIFAHAKQKKVDSRFNVAEPYIWFFL